MFEAEGDILGNYMFKFQVHISGCIFSTRLRRDGCRLKCES